MHHFKAYAILGTGLFLPAILNWLMLRIWLPSWWKHKPVRLILKLSFFALVLVFFRIIAASFFNLDSSPTIMGLGLALTWLPQIALLIALPVAVAWLKIGTSILDPSKSPDKRKVNLSRRAFLRTSTATLPVFAVSASVGGILSAVEPAQVHVKPVTLPNLPDELNGLRILHLTDIHLGGFMGLDHLKEILNSAQPHGPDLVVITGDLADDFTLLPEALNMLEEFKAPLGIFAILGNHEYGNGVKEFKKIIAQSSVKLLINKGHRISVRGATLYLAGVDDILGRTPGQKPDEYMKQCVRNAIKNCRPNEFSVLLTHRPNTFPIAARHKIPLTLAGHTHGGQAALWGHSWLEVLNIEDYVWGFYCLDQSVIYTSCGAGQWAPVRLGCHSEAPILQLSCASENVPGPNSA